MCRVKGNYIPVLFSLPTTYLPTVLIWVILESRAWNKGRHILFGNVIPGNMNETEGSEQAEKGKSRQNKVVLLSGPLAFMAT